MFNKTISCFKVTLNDIPVLQLTGITTYHIEDVKFVFTNDINNKIDFGDNRLRFVLPDHRKKDVKVFIPKKRI